MISWSCHLYLTVCLSYPLKIKNNDSRSTISSITTNIQLKIITSTSASTTSAIISLSISSNRYLISNSICQYILLRIRVIQIRYITVFYFLCELSVVNIHNSNVVSASGCNTRYYKGNSK